MDENKQELLMHVFDKITQIIKGLKNKEFKKIGTLVFDKIQKDKAFIYKQGNFKKIIEYFQTDCLTQAGINGVGLVLGHKTPLKKKSLHKSKKIVSRKSHKGGSGIEIAVLGFGLIAASASYIILKNNFCKWYPDKCGKDVLTDEETSALIIKECSTTSNSFIKIACSGAPSETKEQINNAKIQNANIINFIEVIEDNTIEVSDNNEVIISETPETPKTILLHDLIVNVTNENNDNDNFLNFTHLIPKVVKLSKHKYKHELITWVKTEVEKVTPIQIVELITRAKKKRNKHRRWSGPGGGPERFLSAKLQQLIDTKGGFIDGKFHPKGIEWILPDTTWSTTGTGERNSVQTRNQRLLNMRNTKGQFIDGKFHPKGIEWILPDTAWSTTGTGERHSFQTRNQRLLNMRNTKGTLIEGKSHPIGITHVKPLKERPPLPPLEIGGPVSVFGKVVATLSQTNNGNFGVWIELVIYTFGIILCILVITGAINYVFKKPQPEIEWTFNANDENNGSNPKLKEYLNSKLELDTTKELLPGFDEELKQIKELEKMKGKSGKNAASVGLTKLLKHDKAELEKELRKTKQNHKQQMNNMLTKQVAKKALTLKHRQNMTKTVAKHAANVASKKASQKVSKKEFEKEKKEFESTISDFVRKLKDSLQNPEMFSEIQTRSFNIQQLMTMVNLNIREKQLLETEIAKLNQTVTELFNENEVQKEILDEQELRIEDLSSGIGLKNEEIEQLNELLSEGDTSAEEESELHKEEIALLERQIYELSQLDTSTDESVNRLRKIEEISRSITNNEQNIHSKYTELIKEFITLKKSYDDLKTLLQTKNQEIKANQDIIVSKERENTELKNKLTKMLIQLKEINKAKVQNDDIKMDLNMKIKSHLKSIKQKEADIKGLQSENDELYEKNAVNSTKLISQNKYIQKLIDDVNKQTEELSESQDERTDLVEANDELKDTNKVLITENKKLTVISAKYNEIMQKRYEAKADEARKLNELNQELEEEHNAWEEGRKETGKKYLKKTISNLKSSNLSPKTNTINYLKYLKHDIQKDERKYKGSPLGPTLFNKKRKIATNKVIKKLRLTNNNVKKFNLYPK